MFVIDRLIFAVIAMLAVVVGVAFFVCVPLLTILGTVAFVSTVLGALIFGVWVGSTHRRLTRRKSLQLIRQF